MNRDQSKIFKTVSYHLGRWDENKTSIICEQPVTLTVNNESWLTFMCTPNDLKALALGFLFNEQIIETLDDVASVRVGFGWRAQYP